MKKIHLTLFAVLGCLTAHAQQTPVEVAGEDAEHIPSFFISSGTGINNNTGLFGLTFEKPFGKEVFASWSTGLGMSTWGLKTFGEIKYYFGSYQKAWAIAGGVTFNTGYRGYQTHMYTRAPGGPTSSTYRFVSLTLLPQVAGYVAGYYYYPLGTRVRVFAELGWSVCFTRNKVSLPGDTINKLSSEYQNLVLLYAPGGPIMAGGLSFSAGR